MVTKRASIIGKTILTLPFFKAGGIKYKTVGTSTKYIITRPTAGVRILESMGTINRAAPKPKNPLKKPPKAIAIPQPASPKFVISTGKRSVISNIQDVYY